MSSARGIVAGHGDFAAGMLSAVAQITGRDDAFLAMTNRGLSGPDVQSTLARLVEVSGATVIFTDLPAGSCTMAARRLQRERAELVVVVGTNLATLLDFLFSEDPAAVAVGHAVNRGREALSVMAHGTPRGG